MNKYINQLSKNSDKFDEALAKLKAMAEEAKSNPEKAKALGQAFSRARTAGTTEKKAWD